MFNLIEPINFPHIKRFCPQQLAAAMYQFVPLSSKYPNKPQAIMSNAAD